MNLLYYAVKLSVYPLAFVLTILTTRPGIWILRKLMGKLLSELSAKEEIVLEPEAKLALRVFEEYGVPAAQAIWTEVRMQAIHDNNIQNRVLNIIDNFPTEDRGDLLDRILGTVLDGEVRLVDSIFNGYVGLINATGDMLVKLK